MRKTAIGTDATGVIGIANEIGGIGIAEGGEIEIGELNLFNNFEIRYGVKGRTFFYALIHIHKVLFSLPCLLCI